MEDRLYGRVFISAEGNEYPEPDLGHTPLYPWAGAPTLINHLPYNGPSARSGSKRGLEGGNEALGGLEETIVDRHGFKSKKDVALNVYASPDFEPVDDNSMSDELFFDTNLVSDYSSSHDSLSGVRSNSKGGCGPDLGGAQHELRKKGIKRGQRKPLEPSVEFKALHSQATMAFIDNDYQEAEKLALKAISVNPEMFPAHSLLSEVHMARGHPAKALAALWNGAHTRPRDLQVWLRVAQLILERGGEDKNSAARDALYCFNRIISVDSSDVKARHQRAALHRDLGNHGKAAYDYEYLLKQFPHETTILRLLAETYIDLDDVDKAVSHYNHSLSHYRVKEPDHVVSVSWSDINVYAELYGIKREYAKGIAQIKSLSRWLLGRGSDVSWEAVDTDDREWDVNDEPRRALAKGFVAGQYDAASYGNGLPIELRIKLGIYRLNMGDQHLHEAIKHFAWLDPQDSQPGAKLFEYSDLFREVADSLHSKSLLTDALQFYEPLNQMSSCTDISFLENMAACYRAVGQNKLAVNCYQKIIESNNSSEDVELQLAVLCEELGIDRASVTRKAKDVCKSRDANQTSNSEALDGDLNLRRFAMITPRISRPPAKDIRASQKSIREQAKAEDAHTLFLRMRKVKETAQEGDLGHKFQWMLAAKTLIQDFQSEKLFFPYDRYVRFYGYSQEARKRSLNMRSADIAAEALTRRLGPSSAEHADGGQNQIPNEFLGIPFHAWLDIFLEYAMALSHSGDAKKAYGVISSASEANVFYHCPESLLLIYVCWFTCALMANDEKTLCSVARWFIKDYQFVSDAYRLFSALNRLCNTGNSWFRNSRTQKYILRQIKAMDYSIVPNARKASLFSERAGYSTKDEDGNWITAKALDLALLMLYGHILYVGKSYSFSISTSLDESLSVEDGGRAHIPIDYFLRAFALDPKNPIINLSLALGYIHYAIKRQADNRHQLIMQGFAFLFAYYGTRQKSDLAIERQEAEYNVARAYHLLGLTEPAIAYYLRCLSLDSDVRSTHVGPSAENFSTEAAIALQGLWVASGNFVKARELAKKWLVI